MNLTEAEVRQALAGIFDPCSVSAGCPISLSDMGLITRVSVGDHGSVAVRLRVTAPGCTFGAHFVRQVKEHIEAIEGSGEVTVELSSQWDWSEADIAPEAKRRLAESRDKRRRLLTLRQVET